MLNRLDLPGEVLLLALTAAAAAFDWYRRRIPNWLSLAGCVAGLLAGLWRGTGPGEAAGTVVQAALGLVLGFALYFPLWLLGARGAGDVKLLAAAGSLIGPRDVFALFLLSALFGGVLALALVLVRGALRQTLWNIAGILRDLLSFRRPAHTLQSPKSLRLPHAPVILLAALAEIVIISTVRNG